MAPTLPCLCAAAAADSDAASAITISSSSSESFANTLVILSSSDSDSDSSGSDQSFTNTLVVLSSATATFSTGTSDVVVVVPDSPASRGGDGARSAPRRRRHLPRAAVPVRSPTAAASANGGGGGGGHVTTSRRTAECPSPRSVLSARAPGGVAPVAAPSSGGGDDGEATSRRKRKVRYRMWGVEDELKVLDAMAEFRRDKKNFGKLPQSSVLLKKIRDRLLRGGVDVQELSEKVYRLKQKFIKAVETPPGSACRRRPKYRDRVLYDASKEVWPQLLRRAVPPRFRVRL